MWVSSFDIDNAGEDLFPNTPNYFSLDTFAIVLLGLFAIGTILWALFLQVYRIPLRDIELRHRVVEIQFSDTVQLSPTPVAEKPDKEMAEIADTPDRPTQEFEPVAPDPEIDVKNPTYPPEKSGLQHPESKQIENLPSEIFVLPDQNQTRFTPGNVFNPRLAETIARQRQKREQSQRLNGPDLEHRDTYVDVYGNQHYRAGDVCFQLIHIPNIGTQWYGNLCDTSANDIDFKFKPEKQFEYQERHYEKSRGGK